MGLDDARIDRLVRSLARVDDNGLTGRSNSQAATALAQEIIAMTATETDNRATTPVGKAPARGHGWLRPAIASLAIIVLIVGGLVFVLPSPGGAPAAFAGWEATPSAAPSELLDVVTSQCLPPAGSQADPESIAFMHTQQHPRGVDTRGNLAAAVFADDQQYLICNLVLNDEDWELVASQYDLLPPAAGPITADAQHQWVHGNTAVTTLIGRVTDDARHVTVERADGMPIETTINDGLFIAWWPTAHPFDAVHAYDASRVLLGSDDSAPTGGVIAEDTEP